MRVIDGIHGDAANLRAFAKPALSSGFTKFDVLLVRVGNGTDGRHAFRTNQTQFVGAKPQLSVALILTNDLSIGASRPGNLTAFANLHFNVVNDGADRNALHGHGVARFDIDRLARNDLVPCP